MSGFVTKRYILKRGFDSDNRLKTMEENNLSYREKRNLFIKTKKEYFFEKETFAKTLASIQKMKEEPVNIAEEVERHRLMHEQLKNEENG